MNKFFDFVIATLAVFRLTELIAVDDGPYNMFSRFRIWTQKNAHKNQTRRTIADLFDCPFCLSMWLSFIILLVPKTIRYILAIAGGVSLLFSRRI